MFDCAYICITLIGTLLLHHCVINTNWYAKKQIVQVVIQFRLTFYLTLSGIMLSFSVMQSSFTFSDIKIIAVSTGNST